MDDIEQTRCAIEQTGRAAEVGYWKMQLWCAMTMMPFVLLIGFLLGIAWMSS